MQCNISCVCHILVIFRSLSYIKVQIYAKSKVIDYYALKLKNVFQKLNCYLLSEKKISLWYLGHFYRIYRNENLNEFFKWPKCENVFQVCQIHFHFINLIVIKLLLTVYQLLVLHYNCIINHITFILLTLLILTNYKQ